LLRANSKNVETRYPLGFIVSLQFFKMIDMYTKTISTSVFFLLASSSASVAQERRFDKVRPHCASAPLCVMLAE
jgi:hypothetical protein